MRISSAVAGAALFFGVTSAHAACVYHGKLYVRTTLDQEFRDAKRVVRARVVSADTRWPKENEAYTVYSLEVLETYKGTAAHRARLFTFRDSGGFYLEKGTSADIGGEYLLFLNPLPDEVGYPDEARGAQEVNYACGQSRDWRKVTPLLRDRLLKLSGTKKQQRM